MDAKAVREKSRKTVGILGYKFNPSLPVLDPVAITRSRDEIIGRILALHASVACSYGFPKQKALEWVQREELTGLLDEREDKYLRSKDENMRAFFQWQVESIWALTWAAGYHRHLDFGESCPDSLVSILPDLNENASSQTFTQEYELRGANEIIEMTDLAYCLHWAAREEGLTGRGQRFTSGRVPTQVIVERRRGLEWLICDEPWDEVPMDT